MGKGLEMDKWCYYGRENDYSLQIYLECNEVGELLFFFHYDVLLPLIRRANSHGFYDGTYDIGSFFDRTAADGDGNQVETLSSSRKLSLVKTGTLYLLIALGSLTCY